MDILNLHTRVLGTYVSAITAPSIVALKKVMLSTTGWMTAVLNHCNDDVTTTTNNAASAKASADAASVSAGNALTSENTTRSYRDQMNATMRSINSRWLGVLDNDPDKDLNGDPLANGVEYYNYSTGHTRVYYTSTGKWQDQDQATEDEMTSAQLSAAAAAGSASSANSANDSAVKANDNTQAALASVNTSMHWMNTWWLGPNSGEPVQDLNNAGLTAGATYYDNGTRSLRTYNGSGWYSNATSLDIDYIHRNYVNIDGSNAMTGTLVINSNVYDGIRTNGSITTDNNSYYAPSFVSTLTTPISRYSYFRTEYNINDKLSWATVVHNHGDDAVTWLQLRSSGETVSSGDFVVGGAGSTADLHCRNAIATNGDIAECYLSNYDIPTGTIVTISADEDPHQEVEAAGHGDDVFGVVSTAPGSLLNSKLEAYAEGKDVSVIKVGLHGRVPTRVVGPVKKGDRLYLSVSTGVATAQLSLADNNKVIGFALASSNNEGESKIEVALTNFA